MNSRTLIFNLFFSILIIFSFAADAFSYGYTEKQDPLISMFHSIITEAKIMKKKKKKGITDFENNWKRLRNIVEDDNVMQPIKNLDRFSHTDLYSDFNAHLDSKDLGKLIATTVNLVFLSMMEKYEITLNENFENYRFAKSRLTLNHEYYVEIFEGNVKKYDAKHKTNINSTILKHLSEIPGTMGKPSKVAGLGGEPADKALYTKKYKAIQEKLKKVFPFIKGPNY